MTTTPQYPKRLIEVDLPIKRISAHARREKSIRHGHISTLHIWWARRPLAACRAVICAALWPDPADSLCADSFRKIARDQMNGWAQRHLTLLSEESYPRFVGAQKDQRKFDNNEELRKALLDFIADFSNWDNSTVKEFLTTSRALTQAAHEALGGAPGTRPLVVDPFAGGGSIPLEALRVGADAFASDLNPVAVLLNKVVLEYIPKYGQRLADEVRKWGEWIKCEAEKELAEFYPKDPDGATPIAYLWARTIQCEGPGCGAEVPLIRSLWLAKKANRLAALQLVPRPRAKRVDFQIIIKQRDDWVDQDDPKTKIRDPKLDGTVKRGSATCPCCGYTTPVARIREQLQIRHGGANDARLVCIQTMVEGETGRTYRLPRQADARSVSRALTALNSNEATDTGRLSFVPGEPLPPQGTLGFRVQLYGMEAWADLFTSRQKLSLITLSRLTTEAGERARKQVGEDFASAIQTCLAFVLSKVLDRNNALARWEPNVQCSQQLFGRQTVSMVWDFGEVSLIRDCAGSWQSLMDVWLQGLPNITGAFSDKTKQEPGCSVAQASATAHPLPDDSAQAFVTDPPYYDAVPYADLADFFFVWLKRSLRGLHGDLLCAELTPKKDECTVDQAKGKDSAFFEATMRKAMTEGRRVLAPSGVGIVVFAHKSTAGWESQLQAMIDAGWITTGSWPIDTEMETRLRAQDSAALASSVHLVCRPRENPDGSVRTDEVGDWRDVLAELPRRIHNWMPRLAEEGVVGADAIFACLGPALEIFSRYSRVEKASGEAVTLKEYLEQVWAAVAKEALTMIFTGADATGFEEDARLTAMWLWTLKTGDANGAEGEAGEDDSGDDEEGGVKKGGGGGFVLEFDAARKIAQGLGAHLEALPHVVEVKGETARLLPVAERAKELFGQPTQESSVRKAKRGKQAQLFDAGEMVAEPAGPGDSAPSAGATVLDRVHQAMLLFAGGRPDALRRFVVDEGTGNDGRFWRLAQALSALYPTGTDEKRWIDGVLARKKAFGF